MCESANAGIEYTKIKDSIIFSICLHHLHRALRWFSLFNFRRLPGLQLQIAPSNPLPDIVDLIDDSLEVGSGIVRAGDEDVVSFTRRCWGVQR